jgi:hypothetical protein
MRVRLGPVAGDYTRVEWSLDASCMVTLSALIRKRGRGSPRSHQDRGHRSRHSDGPYECFLFRAKR